MWNNVSSFFSDYLKLVGLLALLQWAVRFGLDPEYRLPHLLDLAFVLTLGLWAWRAVWRRVRPALTR